MIAFVEGYNSDGLYGFCRMPDGSSTHFHAGNFYRLKPGGPGPVTGERVRLEGRGPQCRVYRLTEPVRKTGAVRSYDSTKGWGFLSFGEGSSAFFHASDFAYSWLPVISQRVRFYLGSKDGKPRACWTEPLPRREHE